MELDEALAAVRQRADESRFSFEVWLNVLVTSHTYYRYGWTDHMPAVGGVDKITARYRAAGVIK